MLSFWFSLFSHLGCGLARRAGLGDGKTGLKGKAPLRIRKLARVPWPVSGQQPRSWQGRSHVESRGSAWRAAGGIQLLGKGGRSQALAIATVPGLPAHPGLGSIVPGCHPQLPAMGLFLQLCLCFLISPLVLQKS